MWPCIHNLPIIYGTEILYYFLGVQNKENYFLVVNFYVGNIFFGLMAFTLACAPPSLINTSTPWG